MIAARIQSILAVAGFITLIALSGITLGLAGVSAFSHSAEAQGICGAESDTVSQF